MSRLAIASIVVPDAREELIAHIYEKGPAFADTTVSSLMKSAVRPSA